MKQVTDLLRQDSPEAIEEAIRLLQNTVYSFSMKFCGHPEDAEDTMQEVLYRSIRHLGRMQDPQTLAVWLYTVTRNRCWRMRRQESRKQRQALSLDELMHSEAELRLMQNVAAQSPEGSVLHAEASQMLHQAVLRIPAALRMVLILHDMEELGTEDVGNILGLQPGTVRVRLHRARLAVRKEMSRILEKQDEKKYRLKSRRAKRKGKTSAKQLSQPPECRELFANLTEYMDGRVPSPSCDKMRAHIAACPSCVAFVRELRQAIDRCRSLEIPCEDSVAQRLRVMLTQEYRRMIGMREPGQMQTST